MIWSLKEEDVADEMKEEYADEEWRKKMEATYLWTLMAGMCHTVERRKTGSVKSLDFRDLE